MSTVHRSAAGGFQRGAADYERGRPEYPPAAIELLARELHLGPGRRVVELAAGTGKLTRALVGLGAEVVAVEPVAGMREQLTRAVPGVEVLDGTAEHLPLPDESVDAVLVAQAFHWFDVEVAAQEMTRVLQAGGGLGVVRNAWDRSAAWVDEMQSLIEELRSEEPSQDNSDWRNRLEASGAFESLAERILPHIVDGDRDTLLARVSSISFVATLSAGARRQLLTDVSAILDRHGVGVDGAPLAMPQETHVLWTRAAAGRARRASR